jgi:hypothetical protein
MMHLTLRRLCRFSDMAESKKFLKSLAHTSQKLRLKQTVADKLSLQKFLGKGLRQNARSNNLPSLRRSNGRPSTTRSSKLFCNLTKKNTRSFPTSSTCPTTLRTRDSSARVQPCVKTNSSGSTSSKRDNRTSTTAKCSASWRRTRRRTP